MLYEVITTVAKDSLQEALEIIERHKTTSLQYDKIDVDDKVAKVSVVGAGMISNAGVAATMFEALYNENINIKMICTSEIRITVIINEADAERAMVSVHDKFRLGEM